MPTYEYRCKECGHEFEELESMMSDPLVICPKCGKPALKRILGGGTGMIFKGSGFYQTDYKKGTADPSPEKTDGKKETKSEPKKDSGSTDKHQGGKPKP